MENMLENVLINESEIKQIKIRDIDKIDDYLFIVLDNGQKILTNDKDVYDLSDYSRLTNIFRMGDKLCAVLTKDYYLFVVDLNTMEVLFEDNESYNIYSISKEDDRALHIITERGNITIYDVKTKKYLAAPDNYEFEISLGNNLYVFREPHNSNTNFYDYKRCILNADGKILLKDIDGWIESNNNYLIIKKKNKLCIIKINEDKTLNMKTIEQNERIIAKPTYYKGKIIIMEKGVIKRYTPDLELINELVVDELTEVIDYEIVSEVLKLCLPHTIAGKKVNKHLFINLNTGKSISHLRIEGYPYWRPTTYIGQDSLDSEKSQHHFYTADFNKIISISANSYESIESNKECMFVLTALEGENEHKQFLNASNGCIKDINYDYIHFHHSSPYGYGVNLSTQKMDFFDENLNIIISDFDYKKFNLSFGYTEFDYFIVNGYICISKHYVDNFGQSRCRKIIQKGNGEVILDSIQHKCYAIGDFIQIIHKKDSVFLNTLTGEIGPLGITAATNEQGKIDLKNISNILFIENNTSSKLSPTLDIGPGTNLRKLIPETEYDD